LEFLTNQRFEAETEKNWKPNASESIAFGRPLKMKTLFIFPPFSAFKPGMCGELRERWIELPQAHLSLGMRSLPLWKVGTSCDFRVVDPVPGR
jgi:hypothetical protein